MLSYAAQGLLTDEGAQSGKQLREQLARMVEALRGIGNSCREVVKEQQLAPEDRCAAFIQVLELDANNSLAVLEMVMAQPGISSQLIDNLNASMHLRALLADLFLITEMFELKQTRLQADLNVLS